MPGVVYPNNNFNRLGNVYYCNLLKIYRLGSTEENSRIGFDTDDRISGDVSELSGVCREQRAMG